jgi:hypothetical protein
MARQRFPAEFPARDNLQQVMRDERQAAKTPQVWAQDGTSLPWQVQTAHSPMDAASGNEGGTPFGWSYQCNWKTPMFDLRPDLRSALGQSKATITSTVQPVGAIGRPVMPSSTPIWNKDARLFVQLRWLPLVTSTSTAFNASPPLFPGNMQGCPIALRIQMDAWSSLHALDLLPVLPNTSPAAPFATFPGGELMSPLTDVTNQFCYGPVSQVSRIGAMPGVAGTGVFAPPGTDAGGGGIGHPIRFWMVRLHFTLWVYAGGPNLPWTPPLGLPIPNINPFLQIQVSAGVY